MVWSLNLHIFHVKYFIEILIVPFMCFNNFRLHNVVKMKNWGESLKSIWSLKLTVVLTRFITMYKGLADRTICVVSEICGHSYHTDHQFVVVRVIVAQPAYNWVPIWFRRDILWYVFKLWNIYNFLYRYGGISANLTVDNQIYKIVKEAASQSHNMCGLRNLRSSICGCSCNRCPACI